MAFVKYEVASAPSTEVKVGKLGITIAKSALSRFGMDNTEYVNLYWDGDTHEIGIAASSAEDKAAFKLAPRGRSEREKFVGAKRFYERFGIVIEGRTATSGKLEDRDGIAAVKLDLPKAALPKPPYTGKPRGRRKKVVVAPEE